jgi:hypothetical protein
MNKPVAELVLEQMAVGDASSLRVKWLVDNYPPVGTKLYTHPVELTDEEKWEVFTNLARNPDLRADMIRFADSILRKAQEK